MDSHTESGTSVSSGPSSSSSDEASTSVPVVNNGPGVAKGHGNVTVTPNPNTVIQSSYGNPPASAASSAGPSVTVVRPSMQTAGTGLTINGSNNNTTTVPATVANVATPGITTNVTSTTTTTCTTTTTPLLMNQTPASVSASKSESPKTIIQSAGGMTLGPGVAKGAVLQGVARTAAPATVAAAASSPAIRAIAPQVLAPRLPQSNPGQNIQNIQLPPGTVCLIICVICVVEKVEEIFLTPICDLVQGL